MEAEVLLLGYLFLSNQKPKHLCTRLGGGWESAAPAALTGEYSGLLSASLLCEGIQKLRRGKKLNQHQS